MTKVIRGGVFEAAQPAKDFVSIGVGRQHIEIMHLRTNWHIFAVYLDAFCSRHHRGAARAAGLKAGKQNGIFRVGGIVLEMVQHPSTGRHSARGDDHLWHRIGGERL